MTKNEYDLNGRVVITEINAKANSECLELPALNTTTNALVSKITRSGNDIFISLTKSAQLSTGVRGNGSVGIYLFDDVMDASLIWHDGSGEQRIDLTHGDIKCHFGSFGGIFENPLLALKVIKPEIEF